MPEVVDLVYPVPGAEKTAGAYRDKEKDPPPRLASKAYPFRARVYLVPVPIQVDPSVDSILDHG